MTQQQDQSFAIQRAQETHMQETAATSRAASATALVQARCVMALQRPRDWDTVRTRLLRECARPGFAEVAIYRKPVGGGKFAEGPSVRFAEAAMRHLSNFHVSTDTVYEDEYSVKIEVEAMDLETNVTTSTVVQVQKTVERSIAKDRMVVGERVNSQGKKVYIVACTDDELLTKTNALLSKARRNLIMQLLPGDIADDCEAACRDTQARRDKADPDAAKKKLFDAFAKLGVSPIQLKAYLGHTNQPTPAELQTLREIYAAISTNETTWSAIVEASQGDPEKRRNDALNSLKDDAVDVSIPSTQGAV